MSDIDQPNLDASTLELRAALVSGKLRRHEEDVAIDFGLNNTLDRFLVLNRRLADLKINVVFAKEPKGDEIIRVGRKVLPDIERFQETLKSYLAQQDILLPVLQIDVGTP
ncbi:hypothetical protein ACFSQT_18375 [Mesorhizobium calcicola]|uniref:Uncharacterized protein n=1 Tax=Mesorhizobium calcicola TaxID=1300310 RepID=A0ABW4WHG8_9HYPH